MVGGLLFATSAVHADLPRPVALPRPAVEDSKESAARKAPAKKKRVVKKAEDLVRAGKLRAAVQIYEQIAKTNYALAVLRLGPLYARLGEHEKARTFYEKAVRRRKNDAWAWHCLAYAFRRTKQFKRAAACYRKAYELKPQNPSPLYGLALALKAQGKDAKAAETFAKYARQEKRSFARRWVRQAKREVAALTRKRGTPVQPMARRTPKPRIPAELKNARRAEARGELQEAASLYRQAVQKHRTSKLVNKALIQFLERQGKKNAARIALKMALRRVAGFVWARVKLALFLAQENKPERAKFHLKIAIQDAPQDPRPYCGWGQLLASTDPQGAFAYFKKAFERAAGSPKNISKGCRTAAKNVAQAVGGSLPRLAASATATPARARPRTARTTSTPAARTATRPRPRTSATPRAEARPIARGRPPARTAAAAAPSRQPLPGGLKPAQSKLAGGDAGAAEKLARSYLARHPASYHARLIVAEALLNSRKDLDGARKLAQKAAAQDPSGARARRILGMVALKFRRRDQAKKHFEAFVRLVQDEPSEKKHLPMIQGLLKNLR
jgi:tetratricopeptide (TPR) repeat protein